MNKSKNSNIAKYLIRIIWLLFFVFWLGLVLFVVAVLHNWFGLFGEIPGFEILENPKTELATSIYADEGEVLGKYYNTRRTNVKYPHISKHVIRTLVATEDERYEKHSGVDMRATLRVITALAVGKRAGGGSTISQQLAKNLFDMRQDSIFRGSLYNSPLRMPLVKVKEWITAKRLERAYSKKEIITMYLNTVRFGNYSVGINEAAQTYFSKKPSELNLLEAATLVGTLKANSKYDPYRNPKNSKERRNVVVSQLAKYSKKHGKNYLKRPKDSLHKEPLVLAFNRQDYHTGHGTYFRATIKPELEKLCREQGVNLQTDGLKIYTTINYQLQKKAEVALVKQMAHLQKKFLEEWGNKDPWENHYIKQKLHNEWFYKQLINKYDGNIDSVNQYLKKPVSTTVLAYNYDTGMLEEVEKRISPLQEYIYYKKFLQAGFLVVDPHSGAIKSWVGGINSKYFAYDHVKQGRRQPGSTFKPILYSAAINYGYSPCDKILDVPVSVRTEDDKVWMPKIKPTNKTISLKRCLANSLNNCAALLIRDIGPANVVEHAVSLGIPKDRLNENLSLALGTSELNMFELIKPYMAFANEGELAELHYIKKIEDKNGRILWENKTNSKRVMNSANAYKIVTMLREGVKSGTGKSLNTNYHLLENSNQIGGKTGTTNDSKDGWFVGITKDFACVSWVGVDDNAINFRYNRRWYGGSMALPIFGNFLQSVYRDPTLHIKPGPFSVPESITDDIKANDLICKEDLSDYELEDLELNELDLSEFQKEE